MSRRRRRPSLPPAFPLLRVSTRRDQHARQMIRRVLLVDDHRMFQQGLRLMLEQQLGLTVAAAAASGAEALEQVDRTAFDLVLMDVHLPDASGIEVSRQILARRPTQKIIVLSSDSSPRQIDEALLAGVAGYVLKTNAGDELERAIAAVAAGNPYLSPEANAALLAGYRQLRETPHCAPALSPREREVIRLIAAGQRTKEIADALGIGVKSAETYRHRLMQKLGLYSVAELTRYAVREGLAPE